MNTNTKRCECGNNTILAYRAADLAQILNVSLRHIRRMDVMGKIPRPVRIGNAVRWLASEVEEWLENGAPDRRTWEQMKGGAK